MATRYLLLHGLDGSPPGHWQRWLAGELQTRGELVRFPEFPSPGRPNLKYWLGLLHLELRVSGPTTTIIAHSLGALLWLRYASRANAATAARVLLVAPPGEIEIATSDRVGRFEAAALDGRLIRANADEVLMVGSGNDPYCSLGFEKEYARPLGLPSCRLTPEAGHINLHSGYGPWPFALNWALNSAAARPPKKRAYTMDP